MGEEFKERSQEPESGSQEVVVGTAVRRGAASSLGSSVIWQQAAPESVSWRSSSIGWVRIGGSNTRDAGQETSRWVIPGSRLLLHFPVAQRIGREGVRS